MRGFTVGVVALCMSLSVMAPSVMAQDGQTADEPSDSAAFLDWYGDLRVRGEHTVDIPGRADDIERLRASLRFGGRYSNDSGWEFAAAGKLSTGSDSNDDTRRNLDNEQSNDATLDELYAAYSAGEHTQFRFGKGRIPLLLTPLVWDRDLRPVGASIDYSASVRDFDAFHLIAGYFAGDHLYGDPSRLGAVQIGYGWLEGAETGFSTYLGYLDFTDIDVLAREGLGRTNRRAGDRFVSDYRLLDLQLIGRMQAFEAPLVARLNLVRNIGAEDQRDGARFSLIWGDADELGGLELGYAVQRSGRDAVLAAFSEDDWWFHSFSRGYMPWVAYGFNELLTLQASAFIERRDGISDYTNRWLLDLRSRW